MGGILIASGGAAIARKIHISSSLLSPQWWFFTKHSIFAIISIAIMLGISFMDVKNMRRLGVIMFLSTLPLLILTLIMGNEIKGAQRWIFGLQPSEFIKPSLIVFNAWLMSLPVSKTYISGIILSLAALCLTALILILQPDLGQTVLICSAWIIMFFIAGGHILWFSAIGGLGVGGAFIAYNSFSHVKNRVDGFLNPDAHDRYGINYQYNTAKSAFASGGFTGRGPGEGEIKQVLPDAHTDYIFAVAGEEFGVIFCWMIIIIYAVMVTRCLWQLSKSQDKFTILAGSGLIGLFGIQAFINLSVNLGLLPPKGMTLPFISYGGSSALALGFLTGFLLCLCRKRPHGYSV
ncbi:MAG: cell division protein FtsW [Alphaproteobacteria bacterium]